MHFSNLGISVLLKNEFKMIFKSGFWYEYVKRADSRDPHGIYDLSMSTTSSKVSFFSHFYLFHCFPSLSYNNIKGK